MMHECFHCGAKAVIWDADFEFADYGLEGDGLIHECHCKNCGAEIEYFISDKFEKEGMVNEGEEVARLLKEVERLRELKGGDTE